jgi:hypothetical protein
MIQSKWGATWSQIYEIIFPGADVPSPCLSPYSSFFFDHAVLVLIASPDYDDGPSTEAPGSPSPSSRELADYEAYASTELPRLVEATLEAMIHAETEPLEEKFKPLLVEVVRNCQSNLRKRWDMIKGSLSASVVSHRSPLLECDQIQPQSPTTVATSMQNTLATVTGRTSMVPTVYQEPPFLGAEAATAAVRAFEQSQNPLAVPSYSSTSDSGYVSQQSYFFCNCVPLAGWPIYRTEDHGLPVTGVRRVGDASSEQGSILELPPPTLSMTSAARSPPGENIYISLLLCQVFANEGL